MTEQDKVQVLERAIMEIAEQEAQSILDEARAKADSLQKQAETKAEAESDRILEEAHQKAKELLDQAIAKAQLEAQMLKLQRREQVLMRTFDEAHQRLTTIPERPDYADIVRQLISEAATTMGDEAFVVQADAATNHVMDDAFLQDLAEQLDVHLERGPQLEEGTGIMLITPDGHRRYDNTLETRLTRLQGNMRTAVFHILAGDAA
ncbi:MAG: V-type ATP synthase subunit E [Anaerolineae bacterium]